MFGIVPKPLWEKKIPADNRNRIPLAMRCLLLESSDRLILIDNGIGEKYDERFADIYSLDSSEANLETSLNSLGFGFDDVTDVILTHLHFDHCGGSTLRIGDRFEVGFRNAVFHIQREHWFWALKSNVREKASFLSENLDPLGNSGQLNFIDGRSELYPGVELFPVDGHTKSMQLVRIYDQDASIVFVADLLPTHVHLSPSWNMAYDLWPMKTIQEKRAFLEDAVAGHWKLFFEHDASVAVADVEMTERGPGIVYPRALMEL